MANKKGKAVFPKELLGDSMEENNAEWINEYRKNTPYKEGYYQTLENFFKFKTYVKKPFNLFSISDVSEYIETMIENNFGTNRIDTVISTISSFKKFLTEKHPDVFSENLLKDLLDLKMGTLEKKYNDTQPLNLIQLNYAKEYIKFNIRTEYIFEIFYQLNIKKQDFEICSPKYADKENMLFKKKDKIIKYNHKIQELLDKIATEKKFKVTFAMIPYHLDKIERYLRINGVYEENRKLTYLDIAKTHESYFIKCPNCGKESENLSVNWTLAKIGLSDDYYLVCSMCKGEPINEHIKD